jgi:hypothetical protein
MSQVTQVERMHRLIQMKDMVEDGLEPSEMATKLGCDINTVKRNMKFLDDLKIAELTGKEIAEKRQEIYLELMEASSQAKKKFEEAMNEDKSSLDIKRYFDSWLAALQMRAKLFGVIIEKPEQYIQINNLQGDYNPIHEIPIPGEIRRKLSEALKESHESKMIQDYNEERV